MNNYMGIDHHKQYSHITMLNEKGKKLKSGRVANYRSELERFLDGSGDVKAVIEAGRSSYTMVDILDELSIDVTIAHPYDLILAVWTEPALGPQTDPHKHQHHRDFNEDAYDCCEGCS